MSSAARDSGDLPVQWTENKTIRSPTKCFHCEGEGQEFFPDV